MIGTATLFLTACGFQLRGTDALADLNAKLIFLDSETPYGELESELKRQLKLSGAQLVSDSQPAKIQLKLNELDISSQGASRDATGRANEIILRAKLSYWLSFNDATKPIQTSYESDTQDHSMKSIKVTRSYYQNYRNPVSEQTLRKQTRQEIIAEIVRRLTLQLQWQTNKHAKKNSNNKVALD